MSIRNPKIAARQEARRAERLRAERASIPAEGRERASDLTVLRTPELPMEMIREYPLPRKPLLASASESVGSAVSAAARNRRRILALAILVCIGGYAFRCWQQDHYPTIRTGNIAVRLHASEVGSAVNVHDAHFYFYPYEDFTLGSFTLAYASSQESLIRGYFQTTMGNYTWEDLEPFDCAEPFGELPACWFLGHGYDSTGTARTVLLGFSKLYEGQAIILNAHVEDPALPDEEIRSALKTVFLDPLQVKLT